MDSTLYKWYAEKHRAPSRQEVSLINSAAVPDCPHCHSGDFVKDGKRRDLQGWLNLFWFVWLDPPSRAEKAAKFIEMAISERKRIKYRDVYGKKPDK